MYNKEHRICDVYFIQTIVFSGEIVAVISKYATKLHF